MPSVLSSPKIVIVGAGLSGFAAASKLMESGFNDIVILEAENRTGGRVHSIPFNNGSIDLGAQWVHGQERNVIYALAKDHFKFGDSGFDERDEIFLTSNGKPANEKFCQRLSALSEIILEKSYSEMEKFNSCLGHFFTTKWKHNMKSSNFSDIPAEIAHQMLDYNHKETNCFFASPTWFDISARLNALSDSAKGKQYLTWKTQGFKTVFDYITVSRTEHNETDLQFLIEFLEKASRLIKVVEC